MDRKFKKQVIAKVKKAMKGRYEVDRLCLYWAIETCRVLRDYKIRAIFQAGSASWKRMNYDQDDGVSPTHFTYQWEKNSDATKLAIEEGRLPELHVWACIPDQKVIIDLTTGFQPKQCLELLGKDWPGDLPPKFFWGDADDARRLNCLYQADEDAIMLVADYLKQSGYYVHIAPKTIVEQING